MVTAIKATAEQGKNQADQQPRGKRKSRDCSKSRDLKKQKTPNIGEKEAFAAGGKTVNHKATLSISTRKGANEEARKKRQNATNQKCPRCLSSNAQCTFPPRGPNSRNGDSPKCYRCLASGNECLLPQKQRINFKPCVKCKKLNDECVCSNQIRGDSHAKDEADKGCAGSKTKCISPYLELEQRKRKCLELLQTEFEKCSGVSAAEKAVQFAKIVTSDNNIHEAVLFLTMLDNFATEKEEEKKSTKARRSSPPLTGTSEGFEWSDYPPLENILRQNITKYFDLSTKGISPKEQIQLNNQLASSIVETAAEYGWDFDSAMKPAKARSTRIANRTKYQQLSEKIKSFYDCNMRKAKMSLKTLLKNPSGPLSMEKVLRIIENESLGASMRDPGVGMQRRDILVEARSTAEDKVSLNGDTQPKCGSGKGKRRARKENTSSDRERNENAAVDDVNVGNENGEPKLDVLFTAALSSKADAGNDRGTQSGSMPPPNQRKRRIRGGNLNSGSKKQKKSVLTARMAAISRNLPSKSVVLPLIRERLGIIFTNFTLEDETGAIRMHWVIERVESDCSLKGTLMMGDKVLKMGKSSVTDMELEVFEDLFIELEKGMLPIPLEIERLCLTAPKKLPGPNTARNEMTSHGEIQHATLSGTAVRKKYASVKVIQCSLPPPKNEDETIEKKMSCSQRMMNEGVNCDAVVGGQGNDSRGSVVSNELKTDSTINMNISATESTVSEDNDVNKAAAHLSSTSPKIICSMCLKPNANNKGPDQLCMQCIRGGSVQPGTSTCTSCLKSNVKCVYPKLALKNYGGSIGATCVRCLTLKLQCIPANSPGYAQPLLKKATEISASESKQTFSHSALKTPQNEFAKSVMNGNTVSSGKVLARQHPTVPKKCSRCLKPNAYSIGPHNLCMQCIRDGPILPSTFTCTTCRKSNTKCVYPKLALKNYGVSIGATCVLCLDLKLPCIPVKSSGYDQSRHVLKKSTEIRASESKQTLTASPLKTPEEKNGKLALADSEKRGSSEDSQESSTAASTRPDAAPQNESSETKRTSVKCLDSSFSGANMDSIGSGSSHPATGKTLFSRSALVEQIESEGKGVQKWETRFMQLKEYKSLYGSLDVPKEFPALGAWTRRQRQLNKTNSLHKERKDQLDEIGFDWKICNRICLLHDEKLSDELVKGLENFGFALCYGKPIETSEEIWNRKFMKLLQSKLDLGTMATEKFHRVSTKSQQRWVDQQIESYNANKLRQDRYDKLLCLGIHFGASPTRPVLPSLSEKKTPKRPNGYLSKWKREPYESALVNAVAAHLRGDDPMHAAEGLDVTREALENQIRIWLRMQKEILGCSENEFSTRVERYKPTKQTSGNVACQETSIDSENLTEKSEKGSENGQEIPANGDNSEESLAKSLDQQYQEEHEENDSTDNNLPSIGNVSLVPDRLPNKEQTKKTLDDHWDSCFEKLQLWKKRYGTCELPENFTDNPLWVSLVSEQQKLYKEKKLDADRLVSFVSEQRRLYKEKKLDADRVELLELIGFDWKRTEKRSDKPERVKDYSKYEKYFKLASNAEQNKQSAVVAKFLQELKSELTTQSTSKKMTDDEMWDLRFGQFVKYYEAYGNFKVPNDYPLLGNWTVLQRKKFNNNLLRQDRKDRLAEIGYDFDMSNKVCVPRGKTLAAEAVERLEHQFRFEVIIGECPYTIPEETWNWNFALLVDFETKTSNNKRPVNFRVDLMQDKKMTKWVATQIQHYQTKKIRLDRFDKLLELGLHFGVNPQRPMPPKLPTPEEVEQAKREARLLSRPKIYLSKWKREPYKSVLERALVAYQRGEDPMLAAEGIDITRDALENQMRNWLKKHVSDYTVGSINSWRVERYKPNQQPSEQHGSGHDITTCDTDEVETV